MKGFHMDVELRKEVGRYSLNQNSPQVQGQWTCATTPTYTPQPLSLSLLLALGLKNSQPICTLPQPLIAQRCFLGSIQNPSCCTEAQAQILWSWLVWVQGGRRVSGYSVVPSEPPVVEKWAEQVLERKGGSPRGNLQAKGSKAQNRAFP